MQWSQTGSNRRPPACKEWAWFCGGLRSVAQASNSTGSRRRWLWSAAPCWAPSFPTAFPRSLPRTAAQPITARLDRRRNRAVFEDRARLVARRRWVLQSLLFRPSTASLILGTMRLLRILGVRLFPAPPEKTRVAFEFADTHVQITGGSGYDEGRWHLATARVPLKFRPKRTADRYVVVPDRERRTATAALETASHLLALSLGCRRELSSPNPYVAFEGESDEERSWLDESAGLLGGLDGVAQHSLNHRLELNPSILAGLTDRWDGVALMSEANSAGYATGSFMEYIRLFERAFRMAAPVLGASLAAFLDPRFGYSADEINHWTAHLRGSAAHADQRREFLLESDVRPYVARIKQAAWDVLLNKETWRDPSSSRRAIWNPDGATVSSNGDIVVVQHSTPPALVGQLVDRWQEYPLDLETRVQAPDSWWPSPPTTLSGGAGEFRVVPRAEWDSTKP